MSAERKISPVLPPTPSLLVGCCVLTLLSTVLPWLWVFAAPLSGATVARAWLAESKQKRLWWGLILLWLPLSLWDAALLWGGGLCAASTGLLTILYRQGYDRLNTSLALQLLVLVTAVGAFYLSLAQWVGAYHPSVLITRFSQQMLLMLEQTEIQLEQAFAQQPQGLAAVKEMMETLRGSLSLMLPSLLPGAVTVTGFVAFACVGRLAAGAESWGYPLPNRYTGLLLLSLLAGMLPLGTGIELASSAVASFAGTVLLCEALHWLFGKINAMEAPGALAFMLKGAAVLGSLVLNLYAVLAAACFCLYRGVKIVLPPTDGENKP